MHEDHSMNQDLEASDHARAVAENQLRLARNLRPDFDFIVCGAGSAGCVVAARLAEQQDAHVLLLEAGGDDLSDTVMEPGQWPLNLGSERDWAFEAQPSPQL